MDRAYYSFSNCNLVKILYSRKYFFGFPSLKKCKGSCEGMIAKECQGMKRCANTWQTMSMNVEKCYGVLGEHNGEFGQNSW